jgi:signal transduction histidine kinase
VAARQPRSVQEYEEVVRSCLREVIRLSELAEDLLLLARADAGHLPLELREVSVAHLLREVCAHMSELATEESVGLQLHVISPGSVYADRAQLERVFRNLIENGIKYSKNTGRGVVHVSLSRDGPWVRIDVEDNGVGIAEPQLENIFRRFYRVDHTHLTETEGTGLGLAICHQIVQAHSGRIDVSSRPGQGSTFSVFLLDAASLTIEEDVGITGL